MRRILLPALLGLAVLALPACRKPNKFSMMRPEYGGVVEFPSFPPPPKGVVGYHLYLAQKVSGPWEKITDTPINGGRMMVPYLEPGKEYLFRLTSVASNGLESKPGGILKRKAEAKK